MGDGTSLFLYCRRIYATKKKLPCQKLSPTSFPMQSTSRPLKNLSLRQARQARIDLPRHVESMVESGRELPLAQAIRQATLDLGLGQSETAQDRWRAHVRATARVVFSRERVGRSWVIFIRRQQPAQPSPHSVSAENLTLPLAS